MSEQIKCDTCETVVFVLAEGTKKRTSGVVCYCTSCDTTNKRLAQYAAQAMKGKYKDQSDFSDLFKNMKF
jgi:hypothetical protein